MTNGGKILQDVRILGIYGYIKNGSKNKTYKRKQKARCKRGGIIEIEKDAMDYR